MHIAGRCRRFCIRMQELTPEEDSIGDPDEIDDEVDDLLPADLWFRALSTIRPSAARAGNGST